MKINTQLFNHFEERYLTRYYYKESKKLTQTFYVERVENNILYGELYRSETGLHEQSELDAFLLDKKNKLNFHFSTPNEIYEFKKWKGEVS